MKKGLLIIFILAATFLHTSAQCVYDFSVSQQPYQPLANATSINGTKIWDDANHRIPLGFGFQMDWTDINAMSLVCNSKGEFIGLDTTSLFNGFCILDADLIDKGKLDTVTKSAMLYRMDGSAGNRIFKMEFRNAGFWREKHLYGTLNDSLDMQVWLYEATNVVELHYGPSKITYPSDYFVYGNGPVIGVIKDAGLFQLNLSKLYYLKGDPANPAMDSCGSNISNSGTLNAYPASGTVYKFSPKPNSVHDLPRATDKVTLLNTIATNTLLITNDGVSGLHYEVVSVNGSKVSVAGALQKGKQQVDISGLPVGTYLFTVWNDKDKRTIRFIKK